MSAPHSSVQVDLGTRSYPILIGPGLLEAALSYAALLPARGTGVVVSNETVGPLLADRVLSALSPLFRDVQLILVPDGEVHKNWQTLQQIFDRLLEAKCDRMVTLFALGGGVIGDLTGFAAACYMRGVRYAQLPTTLLAQVDSSVGGKTAINHPLGKNMIGAFHQPELVIADVTTLRTLPQRDLVAGLAEVIKYGAVADDDFLAWTEAHLHALLGRDEGTMAEAIRRSCQIKAEIVGGDERESGNRAILNFGHTFGHAIEAGVGYGEWLHGEAVGCGMAMAADLSVRVGLLQRSRADRIARLVADAGLPVRAPRLGIDRYLELMSIDKKVLAGALRFVLLDGPGRASVRPVAEKSVVETIETFCANRPLQEP